MVAFISRLFLALVVALPCFMFYSAMDNWRQTTQPVTLESAIAVLRSRLDGVKLQYSLVVARNDVTDAAALDEARLRLEILLARTSDLRRLHSELPEDTEQRRAVRGLIDDMGNLRSLAERTDLEPPELVERLTNVITDLDLHFRTVEAAAIEASNNKIVRNIDRAGKIFWLTTMAVAIAAAAAVYLFRRKAIDARLLRAHNAALERSRLETEHVASHDALTGLPNRRSLDGVFREIKDAPAPRPTCFFSVDLDRFKQINDSLGHAAGDHVLLESSARLRALAGDWLHIARVGGDEFVLLSRHPLTRAEMSDLAARIVSALAEPVIFGDHACRLGASVGVAFDEACNDPHGLMVNADIALYHAKNQGRNRYEFYTPALQARIRENRRMADDIMRGLEQREFVPYYQPQIDARTGEAVGVEALVRWRHPSGALLSPDTFLAVAEDIGAIAELDRQILEQAVSNFATWRKHGVTLRRVSVNVSARRLGDETLIRDLEALTFDPSTLAFELLETVFLDEPYEAMTWNIDRLKDLGVDIEIDDFGTGHASISSLIRIAPDRLKIDRSFTADVDRSAARRDLLASIIGIGKALDIGIIAEGIETQAQAHHLTAMGCDTLQGFAFARPMPAEDIVPFLIQRAARSA